MNTTRLTHTGMPILILSLVLLLSPAAAFAANYTVPSQAYPTLNALCTDSGITWQNGDTITITGSDASLTAPFDFGAASITISGYGGLIRPSVPGISFISNSTGSVNINGLSLRGFSSGINGGAISGANVTISGGTNSFYGNSATAYGGAIYGATTISGGSTSFINNSATTGGGAIDGNTVNISGGSTSFINNSAPFGGAIDGNTVTISGGSTSFINNSATTEGGAISGANVTISGGATSFINNSAPSGSAIYSTGGAGINIGASATILVGAGHRQEMLADYSNIAFAGAAGLTGDPTGRLAVGQTYTALSLNAGGSITTAGSNVTQSSGTVIVGAFDYAYTGLAWGTLYNGNKSQDLTFTVAGASFNPLTGGGYAVDAAQRMSLSNPFASSVFSRQNGLFHLLQNQAAANAQGVNHFADISDTSYHSRLWAAPFASHTNLDADGKYASGRVNNAGFVLGYDTKTSDNSFLGGAVAAAWPDYERGGLSADGTDIRLAIYGGSQIGKFQLGYLMAYGWGDFDQTRRIYGDSYNSSYDANPFSLAVKLARPLDMKNQSVVKPFIGYELLSVRTDGYAEAAGAGTGLYALSFGGHTDTLHRVTLGLEWEKRRENNSLNASIFYLGQFGDKTAETTAYFTSDPANPFNSVSTPLDSSSVGLSLGAQWALSKNTELGLSYTGIFGSKSNSQNFDLNFIYKF